MAWCKTSRPLTLMARTISTHQMNQGGRSLPYHRQHRRFSLDQKTILQSERIRSATSRSTIRTHHRLGRRQNIRPITVLLAFPLALSSLGRPESFATHLPVQIRILSQLTETPDSQTTLALGPLVPLYCFTATIDAEEFRRTPSDVVLEALLTGHITVVRDQVGWIGHGGRGVRGDNDLG